MPATCDTSINAAKSTIVVNSVDAEKAAELLLLQQIQMDAGMPYTEAYAKVKAPRDIRPVHPVLTEEEREIADAKSIFINCGQENESERIWADGEGGISTPSESASAFQRF